MAMAAPNVDLEALESSPGRPLAIRVKNIGGQQVGHVVDVAGDHALVMWHHGGAADWCPRLLLRLASPPDAGDGEAESPGAAPERPVTPRPSRRDTPNPEQLALDI